MARVENKCTNCAFEYTCAMSANNMTVVWLHCSKFKPTIGAIAAANGKEIIARGPRYRY